MEKHANTKLYRETKRDQRRLKRLEMGDTCKYKIKKQRELKGD